VFGDNVEITGEASRVMLLDKALDGLQQLHAVIAGNRFGMPVPKPSTEIASDNYAPFRAR